MGTLIEEWGSALFVCCVLHIIHVCRDTGNPAASLHQSFQQNQEDGEEWAGVSQPAGQHCFHAAETSGMAAHALCWHHHPRVCGHRHGLHRHRCGPLCHFQEHRRVGGMTATTCNTAKPVTCVEGKGRGDTKFSKGKGDKW